LIQNLDINALRPAKSAFAAAKSGHVNRCGAHPTEERRHRRTADIAFRHQENRESQRAALYPAVTLSSRGTKNLAIREVPCIDAADNREGNHEA
jgi:predicted aconitase